jgi:hypothetical protein
MRRRITVAVLALCALMAVGAPIIHAEPKKAKALESKYQSLRAQVVKKHGTRAPGRNIVRDGVRTKHGTRAARKADVAKSIQVFRNILSPPAPHPAPATSGLQSGVSPSSSTSSSGAGGLPGCASESGTNYSTGPDNTNPSGATGRYQIIPSTHAAHCSDLGWSPGEQDECAARIYRAQGSGAWVNCG